MVLQDLTLQALNVSLMLSVGLELDREQLGAAARRWRLLLGVIVANFALIPALAVVATASFALPTAVTAGILLCAFTPGGGTGTLLTRTARGNLELSVVMLGLLTALAVPLTPLLVMTALTADGARLDLTALLRTLLLFQLLPLALGVGVRRHWVGVAERLGSVARPLSNVLFAALVLGLLITRGHLVFAIGGLALVLIALLVLASLIVPLLGASGTEDRAALSLTTAVRNLSLSLLLSSAFFGDLTTITVLSYGLMMYLLAVPWALHLRRARARDQRQRA